MAVVTKDNHIFEQMAPYFRFLEASSGLEEPVWTSPYVVHHYLLLDVFVIVMHDVKERDYLF